VCAADAQVKKSSRNLTPLTKPPEAENTGTRSGQTGLGVAAAQRALAETTTQVSFLGPEQGWGFAKITCPYYAPDGKRLGTLPGGTLFKYNGVKPSSRNSMLVCTVKRGDAWEGSFLLDCTDIAGYEGDPDTIDPATMQHLADYFAANGKLAERKAELEKAEQAANPHLEKARQTQQAYQDTIEKAAGLEKQMNAAAGTRREKLMDELRALKYEQAQLKIKADQAASAHTAWKAANPADPAKFAADPQYKALLASLEAARKPVASLVPKE